MKKLFTIILIIFTGSLFAQLPTTDLTISAVKADIGATTYDLNDIATHANINKWSRYKPVDGIWPESATATYGLNLSSNWSYTQPTTEFRLGDFRGYEHDATIALPPIHVLTADAENADLYPYGGNSSNTYKIKADRITSSVITPALLGLDNYYYGFKVVENGNTWYKTNGQVNSLNTTGINMFLDATLMGSSGSYYYNDLPYGTGTYTYNLIITNTECAAWTSTAPGIIYNLPFGTFGGIAYFSGGSITVMDWVIPTPENFNWDGLTTETKEATINVESGTWSFVSPSWITIAVGHYIGEPAEWFDLTSTPAQWIDGKILRATPDPAIATARDDAIDLTVNSQILFNLSVHQDAEVLPPAFVWGDLHPDLDFTSVSFGGDHGSLTMTYEFTQNATIETDIRLEVRNHGVLIGTTDITVFMSGTESGVISLSETLQNGTEYLVNFIKP